MEGETVFPELHFVSTLRAASPLLCLDPAPGWPISCFLEKQRKVQLIQLPMATLCRTGSRGAPPEPGTASALSGLQIWRAGAESMERISRRALQREGRSISAWDPLAVSD